ncbi:MAG: sodium:alanine symporter family protein [Clostridia bacterium]|nr:sodium:alanine symporter family protein [Clostridia bacterium]
MLRWLLTGGGIPILLLLSGVFFWFYLGFRPFRTPKKLICALRGAGDGDGSSPFRAVMLALAGTLGVGNLVGVANALWIGGAGAVFWMWVSALVATVLKYAEILLAVSHRRLIGGRFVGGAYYYIKDWFLAHGWVRVGVLLSGIFALLMVVDSLTMGCMIQVQAVSAALEGVCGVPLWVSGVGLVILTLPVIARGSRGISALTEVLVPIMTAGYVILSAAVLILRRDALGEAFLSIFREAFSPKSVGGGVLGFLTSRALRVGTMRGLLSNEAGCGTAPTAHASANAVSPAAQGVWGIFEVFVDTILLCTATALVILVSGSEIALYGGDAMMLTIRAYASVLGDWAGYFFSAAVLCFGYATLLCWANYGMESLSFLSRRRIWRGAYLLAFAVCICIGISAPAFIWDLSDFAIAALTSINLTVLFLLRREIKRETDRL